MSKRQVTSLSRAGLSSTTRGARGTMRTWWWSAIIQVHLLHSQRGGKRYLDRDQVKTYEKVKIEKAMFDTFNWTSGILNQVFFVLTQSQKLLSAYTAHTLTRIKWHVSVKKLIFNFIPKVAYLQRLYGVKITQIEAIENPTLSHLGSSCTVKKGSRVSRLQPGCH